MAFVRALHMVQTIMTKYYAEIMGFNAEKAPTAEEIGSEATGGGNESNGDPASGGGGKVDVGPVLEVD